MKTCNLISNLGQFISKNDQYDKKIKKSICCVACYILDLKAAESFLSFKYIKHLTLTCSNGSLFIKHTHNLTSSWWLVRSVKLAVWLAWVDLRNSLERVWVWLGWGLMLSDWGWFGLGLDGSLVDNKSCFPCAQTLVNFKLFCFA